MRRLLLAVGIVVGLLFGLFLLPAGCHSDSEKVYRTGYRSPPSRKHRYDDSAKRGGWRKDRYQTKDTRYKKDRDDRKDRSSEKDRPDEKDKRGRKDGDDKKDRSDKKDGADKKK